MGQIISRGKSSWGTAPYCSIIESNHSGHGFKNLLVVLWKLSGRTSDLDIEGKRRLSLPNRAAGIRSLIQTN